MTAPLTDAEAGRLEELAQKATPGPWQSKYDWVTRRGGVAVAQAFVGFGGPDDGVAETFCGTKDAAYIAALDPATVLRLLIERRELRACLGELLESKRLRRWVRADRAWAEAIRLVEG